MSDEKPEVTVRLLRVVRSIVDHAEAVQSGLIEEQPAATHYMRQQLNRVLAELGKTDPLVADLFPPVPDETGIADVATIAKQLLDAVGEHDSFASRAAKAAKHGLSITGENVSVCLSDLAELGSQIRTKVAVALDDAFGGKEGPKDEEVEARIQELERQIKEAAQNLSAEAGQGAEQAGKLVAAAKELAKLHLRKARKVVVKATCCDSEDAEDEADGEECGPSGGCCCGPED